MQRPKIQWVVLGLAVVGLGFRPPSMALTWFALWFGTGVLMVATRHRLPRFVPVRAPAVLPNIDPSRVEGTPTAHGAIWTMLPFIVITTTAPAAAMHPEGAPYFAVPSAMVLVGFAVAVLRHQWGSARVLGRLLRARERITGTIAELDGRFERQIEWRSWSGVHRGTTTVENIHGARVTVATETHTTNGCGTRDEIRAALRITNAVGAKVTVPPLPELLWAAVPEAVGDGDRIRIKHGAEAHTMMLFPVVAFERERLAVGDRVVLAGGTIASNGRVTAERGNVPMLFAVRDGDPIAHLRRIAWRRRAMVALSLGSAAAPIVSMFS